MFFICLCCLYYSVIFGNICDIMLVVIALQFFAIGAVLPAGNILTRNNGEYANYLPPAVFYAIGLYHLVSQFFENAY